MKWDVSSITQLVMAAVAAFAQIWTALHGAPIDPVHAAMTVAVGASGVGHASNNGAVNGR